MADLKIDVAGDATSAVKSINDVKVVLKELRSELAKADIGSSNFNKLNTQLRATEAHLKQVTSVGKQARTSFADLHKSTEGVRSALDKISKIAFAFIGLDIGIRAIKQFHNQLMGFAKDHQTTADGAMKAYEKSMNHFFTAVIESDIFKKTVEAMSEAFDFAAVLVKDKELITMLLTWAEKKFSEFGDKLKQNFWSNMNPASIIPGNAAGANFMSVKKLKEMQANPQSVGMTPTGEPTDKRTADQMWDAMIAYYTTKKKDLKYSPLKADTKKDTEDKVKALDAFIKKQEELLEVTKDQEAGAKMFEESQKESAQLLDNYLEGYKIRAQAQAAMIDEIEAREMELYNLQVNQAEQATDLIYDTMTSGWKRTLARMKADLIKSGILSAATSLISGNPLSFIGSGLFGKGGLFGGIFAEGGYTAPGGKYQPAGIVHAGEWVASQSLVNNPTTAPMIAYLERMQRRGYADGGYVSTVSNPIVNNSMQAFLKFDGGAVRALDVELKTVAAFDNERRGIT